jgi:hypothetical protein
MTDAELLQYIDIPFKFWTCSTCPSSIIKWVDAVATCQNCGKSNKEEAIAP